MKFLPFAFLLMASGVFAQKVAFIGCPVYRDTDAGRKSSCWLSDRPEDGVRYDITQSPTKPDWNRAVLVEGNVAATQDGACGGKTLDPVRVSILPEGCPRHMLPAEGFAGRAFVLPERTVAPLNAPRSVPQPPFDDRTFALFFDWNRDFMMYQYTDYLFDQAVAWLLEANPRSIIVTGYAATHAMSISGQAMSEPLSIAQARAETVTEALTRMGVDSARIETQWEGKAAPLDVREADGLAEPSRPRVEIAVQF